MTGDVVLEDGAQGIDEDNLLVVGQVTGLQSLRELTEGCHELIDELSFGCFHLFFFLHRQSYGLDE